MTITQIKTVRFHGLNLTATEALLTLAALGQTDMSGLAAELAVSSASITAIADRLVKARLIIRSYSRDDRRTIYLTLTELGAARVQAITGKPVERPVTTPITAAPALGLRYTR
jgi:DNA-binding MarR family transcriptional regulator